MKRVVIIGNSGSGKSFLARKLGERHGIPLIHLDELFWLPGGFKRKRPAEEVDAMIRDHVEKDEWIAEGVFGDLAGKLLPRATHLIWLDLPWEVCRASLWERGSESSKQLDPAEAEENFRKLLMWAEGYPERTDGCSRARHLEIYDGFGGWKKRVVDRGELEETLYQGSSESKTRVGENS